MFTSSFGCTSSPASDAITSFAFMFDEVPEPVWKTSIGNWSSSSPEPTRSPAAAMRCALSASRRPSSAFDPCGGGLDPAEPARDGRRESARRRREVVDCLARLAAPELPLRLGLGHRIEFTGAMRARDLGIAIGAGPRPEEAITDVAESVSATRR